jgi:hypothetical protein
VRAADGTITEFDPPTSVTTTPQSVNDDGVITGYFSDKELVHGFIRAVDGTFTKFDPQGSTYTLPLQINGNGTIAGYYLDANNKPHGFVRNSDGTIAEFDPPKSAYTFAVGLDERGRITGYYNTARNIYAFRSFLRRPDGTSARSNTLAQLKPKPPEKASLCIPLLADTFSSRLAEGENNFSASIHSLALRSATPIGQRRSRWHLT